MKFRKIRARYVFQALLLLVAAVWLPMLVMFNINENVLDPVGLTFEGEYSIDRETWMTLEAFQALGRTSGDLYCRGRLTEEVPAGERINFYLNHTGYAISVNGRLLRQNRLMGMGVNADLCGRTWDYVVSPGITPDDLIEIHLRSMHEYGRDNAYQSFFVTLCMTPNEDGFLETALIPWTRPCKAAGLVFLMAALVLVSAAIGSAILDYPIGGRIWKFGVIAAAVGGFFLLDTMDFYAGSNSLAFNTSARLLCMMFVVQWMAFAVSADLSGRLAKVANVAAIASAVLLIGMLIPCFMDKVLLYDMMIPWIVVQLVLLPLMIVLCAMEVWRRREKMKVHIVCYIALFIAFLLDIFGVAEGIKSHATCTKITLSGVAVVALWTGAKNIIENQMAGMQVEKLEKELADSYMTTMFSQIRPHFIYNTLGSIHQLCLEQPEKAAELVLDFSKYLRGNFTEMDNHSTVRFAQEIEHVRHYVRIENIRFPDMEVQFDLQVEDFLLPALTVQPLVENAIKHGLMGLEEGGTIVVSTYETKKDYCIRVQDNGVGFDKNATDDKKHVGLQNIRRRLETMCSGTLTVESEPGVGTTALITIPKEKNNDRADS